LFCPEPWHHQAGTEIATHHITTSPLPVHPHEVPHCIFSVSISVYGWPDKGTLPKLNWNSARIHKSLLCWSSIDRSLCVMHSGVSCRRMVSTVSDVAKPTLETAN
jgi:hypothetical protein